MSDLNSSGPRATDWTNILSDPDLVRSVGKLLQAYREALPEQREEALLKTMKEIKAAAAKDSKPSAQEQHELGEPRASQALPTAETTFAGPPFEPDIFTPNAAGDRRHHPRIRCFVAVELRVDDAEKPIWGNLFNTSVGGCLVETVEPVKSGAKVEIGLWLANGKIWVKGFALTGIVTRSAPSTGVRLRFDAMGAGDRENLRQFLKYVQEGARAKRSEDSYMALLK
ncbi:MAG TPA: PilZ domain-containing protein [Candidatus Sulfotelmatobacter sp.]